MVIREGMIHFHIYIDLKGKDRGFGVALAETKYSGTIETIFM